MDLAVWILFLISMLATVQAGVLLGCYKETSRSRHFSVNPGDYGPDVMTIAACTASCGTYDFNYAALTSGKFCYCANSLPDIGLKEANTNCDLPCVGDTQQKCGGKEHLSVYNSGKRVSGLSISSDAASSAVSTGAEVTIDIGVDSGHNVVYRMDYGDGAGQTTPNVTDMLTKTFYTPGEYDMLVYANDVNQTFQDQVAGTAVRVDAPPGEVEIKCEDPSATHEPCVCTATVWSGSSLELDISVVDSTPPISYTFAIEDPLLTLAGPPIPSKNALTGIDTASNYLMLASEFSQHGKILAWEFFVDVLGTGTVTMMVLEPGCTTPPYCYSSNNCLGACDSTSHVVTSCPGASFCMQYAKCSPACTASGSRYSNYPATYKIKTSVSLTATGVGYQYLSEASEILVEPGYVLGLSHNTGDAQLGRLTAATDEDDRSFVFAPPADGNLVTVSSSTPTAIRHSIRAIGSGGSQIHLPFTFEAAGNFTITATATSRTLSSSPTSGNTVIRVLEGINATILDGPDFGMTDQNVEFFVEPHTGNSVLYNWTFGSEEYLMIPQDRKAHTFNSLGTYMINVTAYNSISNKFNTSFVTIQDEVIGLAISTPPTILGEATDFSTTLAGGSNYSCVWNYGDSSSNGMTNETTTPVGTSNHQHTYAAIGDYTASVSCSNDVSHAVADVTFKVQEEIINLQMVREGADTNTDFRLEWTVDSGTEVTCTLQFDSVNLAGVYHESTYSWRSDTQTGRPASSIPLEVYCDNMVSNGTISTMFKILSVIVDPVLTIGAENVSSHTPVTFTVDMASGSDVTVEVDYKDGSKDTLPSTGLEWTGSHDFTHSFTMGGRFQVTASFSNAEGTYTSTQELLVLVSVGSIKCIVDEYSLYHPPAQVSLTLEGNTMPTEPVLTLHWGEHGRDSYQPALMLNTSYDHTYGDTGVFTVNATIENIMGTKHCSKEVTIVEKLVGPEFQMALPKAAVNQPFIITFCLFRGPSGNLCNLTYDFGNGATSPPLERLGMGKYGCDENTVTYTDTTTRIITVTAVSPLESITHSTTVEVIYGALDADLTVTSPDSTNYNSQTQFTIHYTGLNNVDMLITFDYGDGNSKEFVSHTFNGAGTFRHSHIFSKDGLYTALVTIHNDAFKVEKTVTFGIYKVFSNPVADIYYLAEKPPGQKLNGFAYDSLSFPVDKTIYFGVDDDNHAYADSYELTITKSGGTPETITFTTPDLNYTLVDHGTYTATVKFINKRNEMTTTTYTLQTFQLIEGLEVKETNLKVEVDEPKVFTVTFDSIGTSTCVYVDYGTGLKHIFADNPPGCTKAGYESASDFPMSSVSQLTQTYVQEGYYELKVEAENPYSSQSAVVGFSITGLDCTKPEVDIFNRHAYFTQPENFLRGERIQIRGISRISCGTSFDNVKNWTIEEMNPQYDTVVDNIDMSSLVTDKAELNLPPRFLKLGLYRISYVMKMTGDYGSNVFISTAFTYIKVNPSHLIGIMVPGGNSKIKRGQLQTITLDPLSLSLDPDVDPIANQGLTVVYWTCTLFDGSHGPGCAGIDGSNSNIQTPDLSLMSLGNYRIKVLMSKIDPSDSREVMSEIILEVASGSLPVVVIRPREGSVVFQESDGYKVLKSSRLSLECLCEGCPDPNALSYKWTIALEDYRWAGGWRPLTEEEIKDRILAIDGLASKELAIDPEIYEVYNSPLMQATCELTQGSTVGSVSTNLKVNDPPTPGTCEVSPLNRTFTQEAAWNISVSGWSDDDGIKEYQFFIHTSDDEIDRQITSRQAIEDSFTLQVSLTEAYAYHDFKETIYVKVRDSLGAINQYKCAEVIVGPIPLEEIKTQSQDIKEDERHNLKRLFAQGDQTECSEKSISIFSSLNSASKRSRKEYAGYRVASNFAPSMYGQIDTHRPSYQQISSLMNDPDEEFNMESERDTRAEVRKEILKDLSTLEIQSVIAIQQVSSCFAEAVIFSDEIIQETQDQVMDSLAKMNDFISNTSNLEKVPQEDLEVFVKNGVATVGGISDASGKNAYFGTLSELADSQLDPQFQDYDPSIDAGVDLEMEETGTFDEALALHTARVHKKRQAASSIRMREKVSKALDKFAEIFNHISVPSQTLEVKTQKIKMALVKSDEKNLKGLTINAPGSSGGCSFPDDMFLGPDAEFQNFVASVIQSTNYPFRYSPFAESRISNTSNFITVNLFAQNNTKLNITNLPKPVKVTIPHDAHEEKPAYIQMNPIIPSWNNLMSFVTDINFTHSALFMDFGDLTGRQLLLVVTKWKEPKILADPIDDQCDSIHLLPSSTTQDLDNPDRFRFVMGNDTLANFTGKLYVGVRELNSTEFDMDISGGCSSLLRYDNGSDYFRGNFSLRQYVAQCLAISDTDEDWTTDGCFIGTETNTDNTVCYCTHLTTFAGGWAVVPNTIDWSYVFANADFLSNPTIYITQIVIVVLFILSAIYARFKDKSLKEKLGIAPLDDNDPKDKYFYEIIICTGMRRNAGTNSQVCFILSGEDDETEIRACNDKKRKIFRRGQVDGFLMSVPRPLGYLNFIRIWHDNSGKGKFGSWYLNYIIVRDIQTGVKQVFIANRWFAVEEDDGQVDRVLPVAGKEQLADFSYQFGERTRKNLADGHLWFSVVARPPQSRFTCLQRVCCILCLLYVTMLANAMFYNTSDKEEQGSNAFAFGPFSVSPEQIFIGVISNLIVFPVNFLLIFLFRKSRPHHKRPSRIDRAIKEVNDQSKQTSINDVKPEVSSIFSVSKTPTLPHDLRDPDASRPGTALSMSNDKTALTPKKEKKCELPWYFVIIAWILLWIVTLGAAAMVTFYGISFKDETCKKWISSMLVSFFMSVFITQPIKVFLFAIILSLIIKNPGEEKEDEEDDEEEVHNVHVDDTLLHENENIFGAAKPRKIGYKPPDPAILEKHRARRLKEIKMWAVVREVTIYSFFLWILMVISYRQLGASHFLYKDTMHRVFIANNDTDIDFHKVRDTNEFWKWARSGLVNGIRAGEYYNDYPPLKLRAYINDKVSRILGYATMRQLRIQPALCDIPDEMKGIISQCNVKYDISDQEERTFRPGWLEMRANDTVNDTRKEYTYSTAESLNGYPYWGILSWYSGGGYVVDLVGSDQDLMQKMDQLQEEKWIDKYTRAIFVEFTVYNAQVNLFAIGTIIAEFHPSGGLVQSFRFEPAMLLPYMNSAMLFQIVCEITYLLFVLFFIIHELRELIRTRLNYFKSFWNLVEIIIISMSVTGIVIFFYRMLLTNDLTKAFKETNGNGYVKFQYVAYWNETFSYMIGVTVFFATLKFLKLLRFNKKITLLSATLKHSAKSLLHFGIIFGIVFLAFAQLFYLTYMNIDIDYSTFISSVVASVLMMMGKFNIYTMIMAEPILTQIFVLLFVVSVTFVIVNMFVSILNETFTVVRADINKQGNDYEIVDFMVQSFRKWTGIGGAPQQTEGHRTDPDKKSDEPFGNETGPDYIQDFPDRIDRLLQSISAVYTDNDNFAQMYKKQPYQSGSSNPKRFFDLPSRDETRSPGFGNTRSRRDSDVIARVHTH